MLRAGTRIQAALPHNTFQSRVFQEKFVRPGLLMDVLRSAKTQNREVVAVALNDTKNIRFLAEFDIRLKPTSKLLQRKEELEADIRAKYLSKQKGIQTKSKEVRRILKEFAREKLKKKEIVQRIFGYCTDTIALGEDQAPIDARKTLQSGVGNTLGKARAMVALCRGANIPARLVVGFILEESENVGSHTWVEVYLKNCWNSYDPTRGYESILPSTYIPVCYNHNYIVQVTGVPEWDYRFSVAQLPSYPGSALSQSGSWLAVFDFTRMPSSIQEVIALLLLLPVGTLITAIFRNIIGIGTFGTFSPCLLALSFVYSDWRTGLAIFAFIMFVGFTSRGFLNHLKLLIIPRLSIVLTLVVLCMVLAVSFLDYLKLTPSTKAALLPIVILTMLIEHFHISVEEDGYRYAFNLTLGTLVVAFCCYIILSWRALAELALMYPEGELFIVGIFLLLGRYAGYRLTDWIRFHDLVRKKTCKTL